ncbi:hypothetical protein GCM10017655_11680 [Pseudomonas turukhanskensis]|uniref:Polysaccharide pyruvyl transferase domain-containing protein n=2 Tax=Pseudomonas turukhanskensis TaxID=1806536 RepID=A0A9W6NEZ3_9PSED|nr:hypothetical protein GCM10017655_11680 [Pseudomonas turukhanskensis]
MYLDAQYRALLKEWHNDKDAKPWPRTDAAPVVLIIPPDPALLTASKGDEAMLSVVTTYFKRKWPNVQFIVATAEDEADKCARALGTEPLRILDENLSLKQSLAMLEGRNICASVTVGADVLDGSYSQAFSGKLIMLTGMLSRRGIDCVVTGFSVSEKPYGKLKFLLDEFSHDVVFNLRDPLSFSRFQQLTSANAKLVADLAFLLEPQKDTDPVQQARTWIDAQHALGRKVIGLNMHPLLLDLQERQEIHRVVEQFSSVAKDLIQTQGISVLLIDHDFRGDSADYHCLDPLEKTLAGDTAQYTYRPATRLSAAELKGVAGYLDGIVSGRMHLMIASCGAGTPVFGIEYKGKMSGLMKHFQMDTSNLSNAHEIMNEPQAFKAKLLRFIENLSTTKQQLTDNKTEIKRLSSLNFAKFA